MTPSNRQVGNIIISGLTASGKTTHAGLLARHYNLAYLSASQTMLKLAGLPARQAPDFWITRRGMALGRQVGWEQVDKEIRRAEAQCRQTVFDCLSLPWLHRQKCLVIWLESSLESRVMKAIVSHRGQNDLTPAQVEAKIRRKDQTARREILNHYQIDIFQDRTPFDLIIDTSRFITAPVGIRRERAGTPLWMFFLILFLLIWASGIWITPFGPLVWGVPWLTLLLVGIIFALLLMALLPPPRRPRTPREAIEQAEAEEETTWAISIFFWLLVIFLIIVIVVGYL